MPLSQIVMHYWHVPIFEHAIAPFPFPLFLGHSYYFPLGSLPCPHPSSLDTDQHTTLCLTLPWSLERIINIEEAESVLPDQLQNHWQ